ncbi:maltose permease, putative [Ixodes scapularis]|uniref:Maltose permease, putative n=1 Tax=Ixodes scapularis TaxID=6945 RepID=B7PWP0_IXOSC|nr:maltose permease, putative [Ixodes scapularis]|eukprot:XP_002410147.1 maltose permease, putative [Ixodes scapularis]
MWNISCWRSLPDATSSDIQMEFVLGNNATDICKIMLNRTAGENEESCELNCSCQERSPRLLAFYLYVVFVVIASVLHVTVSVISDAVTCEFLGDNAKSFGQQRLWGAISYGLCSALLGFVIDEANKLTKGRSGYFPCFILFSVFLLLDMSLLCCIPRWTMEKVTATFFRDVRAVFSRLDVTVFVPWACLLGTLFIITQSYTTWFLEDMEASKLIIGLYTFVSTLVELPLLFFSEPILKRTGCFSACSLSFASYAVSYVGCTFVRNPWFMLLTAIPNGAAFLLAVSSITVFAKEAAPSGTTASVMCILSALGFNGIGKLPM